MTLLEEIRSFVPFLLADKAEPEGMKEAMLRARMLVELHNTVAGNALDDSLCPRHWLRRALDAHFDAMVLRLERETTVGSRARLVSHLLYILTAPLSAFPDSRKLDICRSAGFRLVDEYLRRQPVPLTSDERMARYAVFLLIAELLYPSPETDAQLHRLFREELDSYVAELDSQTAWDLLPRREVLWRIALLVKACSLFPDSRYCAHLHRLFADCLLNGPLPGAKYSAETVSAAVSAHARHDDGAGEQFLATLEDCALSLSLLREGLPFLFQPGSSFSVSGDDESLVRACKARMVRLADYLLRHTYNKATLSATASASSGAWPVPHPVPFACQIGLAVRLYEACESIAS